MNQESRPRVAVVGSFMMDLVVQCNHLPLGGQTVVGQDFVTFVGGKGSNQAIAAARLPNHRQRWRLLCDAGICTEKKLVNRKSVQTNSRLSN